MITLPTEALGALARQNVHDIVTLAIEHDTTQDMLVIYDLDSPLSSLLTDAYRESFPEAMYINFNQVEKQEVLDALAGVQENDLVVLVQSGDFRLSEFRIRLHLFERNIKVIDHRHLLRNTPETHETYINALAYDPKWYRGTGGKLQSRLGEAQTLEVVCGSEKLTVTGGLESPKPNLGDYREMKNIGGTFPIGEVFSEAKNLSSVNGSLMIYAFADVDFNIAMHESFRIDITDGIVTGWGENTPQAFIDVIEKIKTNERPILRELGFGLNRAITREKYLHDITAFERILGMHVSIGEKHTVYKKEGITAKKTRFHVDLFVDVDHVTTDGTDLFKDGAYIL